MKKIFLSHAHADGELAENIAELFCKSLNIPNNEIMCTSNDKMKLSPGASIDRELLKTAREANVFICLNTEHSRDSSYMFQEIGARLSDNGKVFSLVKRDSELENILDCLKKDEVSLLESKSSLYKLVKSIGNELDIPVNEPYIYIDYIEKISELAKVNIKSLEKAIEKNTMGLHSQLRSDGVFQNFILSNRNLNAIYYYWAQASNNSYISISHNIKEYFIRVSYFNNGGFGCNFSVRPQDAKAVIKGQHKYLTFQVRLSSPEDTTTVIGIRVTNGYMQQWQYCTGMINEFIGIEVDSCEWKTFEVDLEDLADWKIFESDGIGSRCNLTKPDFTIIACVNFSLGGLDNDTYRMSQGNVGKSNIDFKNILLK